MIIVGTLIAIEGISGSNAGMHAVRLMRELAQRGVDSTVAPLRRADVPGPLEDHTPALIRRVARPLQRGQVVIAAPFTGSLWAYREAAGQLTEQDMLTAADWAERGLVPDLTLLLDVPPERAVQQLTGHSSDSAAAAYHAAARDLLIKQAGRRRTSWRALVGGIDHEEMAADILSHVEWLLHCRDVRWPIDDAWRRPARGQAAELVG